MLQLSSIAIREGRFESQTALPCSVAQLRASRISFPVEKMATRGLRNTLTYDNFRTDN